MKRIGLVFPLLLIFCLGQTQDVVYGKKIIDTLTTPHFWGRGYTNNGMKKAADFLAAEFGSYGLQPLSGKRFLQEFSYPANTFPGKMKVTVNGKVLRPGYDFIVAPESRGIRGKGILVQRDSTHFIGLDEHFVLSVEKKLTWGVSGSEENYTSILLNKKSFHENPSVAEVNIENKLNGHFKAANVCGLVKGTVQPDSLLVITAHYDHLGGMGSETYFPGANDDASGVALLLSLAQYYCVHPPPYSIAFICFAGEEAGLVGSKYFSDNPMISLKKIRFLVNLDLVGTGEEGITVVNGSVFKNEFALLNEINNREKYLVKIKSRGRAANSDHYWFTEKGVPSFFIYAMGGIQAYHDVHDRGATLPLTEFEDLFRLIVAFNRKLMD